MTDEKYLLASATGTQASRRSVLKAAAWAAPVVAVAAAAPLAAATEPALYSFAANGGAGTPGGEVNTPKPYVRIRLRSNNLPAVGQTGIVFSSPTDGFELVDLGGNVVSSLPGTTTDSQGRSYVDPAYGTLRVKAGTPTGTLGAFSAAWTSPAPESKGYSTDSLDLEAL